jgi:hypothetical protein
MNRDKANLYYLALIFFACMSLFLNGCATANKSIGLGGAIGAGGGATLGGIVDPGKNGEYRTRNVIVGAALGGIAGMFTGSVIHDNTEKEKREAFLKGQALAPLHEAGAMPAFTPARVESQWIEAHPVGTNRWVDGHFEYLIAEPARWSP